MMEMPEGMRKLMNDVLSKLIEKYNLIDNQGQIIIEWENFKIGIKNFAIKEELFKMYPIYLILRTAIQKCLDTLVSDEVINSEKEKADTALSEVIVRLIIYGIDESITDPDILLRKMGKIKGENHATFVMDIVQAFDYAFFRGNELVDMMESTLASGDKEKIEELDKKNILPYRLVTDKEEIINEIIEHRKNKEKPKAKVYDLSKMRVIGEA
jgi:hypothetical protein